MASLSSTKTSMFASESHLLTGRYVTSYPNLFTVKFLILTFSRFENHFRIITLFFSFLIIISFFLNLRLCFVNNLIFPTCQDLLIPIPGPSQKFLFPRNFNFTFLGNYIWLLNFLVNSSCTAIDQYCHIWILWVAPLSPSESSMKIGLRLTSSISTCSALDA